MSSTFFSNNSERRRNPISLTPLIDVVFILLLFFMLSSTFSPLAALDIKAVSHGADQERAQNKPLIIQIEDNQQWLVNNTRFKRDDPAMMALLQQAQAQKTAVLIQAKDAARVQHLVDALTIVRLQGITNLNIGESVGNGYVK